MPSTVGADEEATSTMTPMPPRIDRHIPDLITLEEAGRILGGISRQAAHKMVQVGHLPARRVGSTWVVRRVVAERLAGDGAEKPVETDAARDNSSTEEEARG